MWTLDHSELGRFYMVPRVTFFFFNLSAVGGSVDKESTCNEGDVGSIPVSGRQLFYCY